jgi:hypothetical protein
VSGDAAQVGSELAQAANDAGPLGYYVDSLFRTEANAAAAHAGSGALSGGVAERATGEFRFEAARIFINAIPTGTLPAEDVRYLGQSVARRTGLTQPDAEKRVIDTYARAQARLHQAETAARAAADTARKATAYASLWLFISLLGGAFIASLAATFGGRSRDL